MTTQSHPSPYAEFLSQIHEQPLENGPTIRLEVEPEDYHPRVSRWIEDRVLPILGSNSSEWRLVSTCAFSAIDPVGGGPCHCVRGDYASTEDSFETALTVLLVPIPHSAH